MLTMSPSEEMIKEWKELYQEHRKALSSNRKSGMEVDAYFREQYAPVIFDSDEFKKVVEANILANAYEQEKLPEGKAPQIVCYKIERDNIMVGIDLLTGYIHVESENIDKAEGVYNDLFVFRGLDEKDLENFFLVAQYIKLTGRYNK